jgi:hypothetical protein
VWQVVSCVSIRQQIVCGWVWQVVCGYGTHLLTCAYVLVWQEQDAQAAAESGVKKRGNSALTVAVPVVVTSGFSFVLLKFLNK